MRIFQALLFVLGAIFVLADGFVVAGPLKTSLGLDTLHIGLKHAMTGRESEQPVTDVENSSNSTMTCCPDIFVKIFGYKVCGPEFCNTRWTSSINESAAVDGDLASTQQDDALSIEKRKEDALCCFTSGLLVFDCHFCSTASSDVSQDNGQDGTTIPKEGPSIERRKEDALCCFTSGLLVFDCHFCYAPPPGTSQVIEPNTNNAGAQEQDDKAIDILEARQKKSSSEPCCVKGPTAIPVYDCNQCRKGPQDSPPNSKRVFKRREAPEVCCWDLEMANPTCWMCRDKAFDKSATIWTPIEDPGKNDSVKYVNIWSPTTSPSVETRDMQHLCCWPGTITVSSCWPCDPTRTPGVEIWQSQNDEPWTLDSTKDFRFQITRPYSSDASVQQVSVDRCCVVNIVWICYDCPSDIAAIEVPKPPYAPATMTHAKRGTYSREIQARHLIEQCCYTSGLIIHDCHTCGDFRPVTDLNSGVWELEDVLQNGHSFYKASTYLYSPGLSADIGGLQAQLFCISDDPARMLCEPYTPEPTLTAAVEVPTDLTDWSTPTATNLSPRQQTYNFHVVCGGLFDQYEHKCSKGKSIISGDTCESSCTCTDLGKMECKGSAGTECSDQETTNYCFHGSPSWACSCSHQSAAVTEWPNIYPTGL